MVQDFRELNNHSHIDKYSMKEITECIGDNGIRILANATRRKITAPHGIYNSRPGPIPFDHVTSGLTGLPSQFSMLNGRSDQKYLRCHCLHQSSA
jgi:hypothetical protein